MNAARDPEGRFAEQSFTALYDALAREMHRLDTALELEVKRIDGLRVADQISLQAALVAAKTAVDAALAAAEKAVAAALIAAKEAVNKAEVAQQRTNEGQNEFRAQLKDQAATFLTRNEYQLAHNNVLERLQIAIQEIGLLRTQVQVGPPSLTTLQSESDARKGRDGGTGDTWKTVIASIGAAGAAATIITLLLNYHP